MTARTGKKLQVSLDMLRAFVSLSRTLNVSDAAEELNVTRQTLRRNINELEQLRGGALLTLQKGRYVLTTLGEQCLRDANDILWRAKTWDVRNSSSLRTIDGFEHGEYRGADGTQFISQQHSLSAVKTKGLPLLQEMIRAWGASLTQLDDPEMEKIRPYLVIYRRSERGWICADVGDKSAYRRWFGWAWARSAKGALSDDDQAGDDFNSFISRAYSEIYFGGGIRLDHLYAHLPREDLDKPEPVSFQRILAGCVFPNGQQALAVLVAMTNNVEIRSLEHMDLPQVPAEFIMDNEEF